MHDLIVKQGLAVIVAFCYSICLFKNPAITISKVVGCEGCVRENKLVMDNSCNFWEKKAVLMPFG